MKTILSLPWWAQALIASFFIVPLIVMTGYLRRAWHISAPVIAFWYYVGLVIGVTSIPLLLGLNRGSDYAPSMPLVWMLLIGVLFGGPGYIMFYNAMAVAPNAGIASAIFSSNSVWAMFVLAWLGFIVPKEFPRQGLTWVNYVGVLVLVAGVFMACYKPPQTHGGS